MKTNHYNLILACTTSALLATSLTGGAAPTTPSRVSTSSLSQSPYFTSGVIWGNGWRGSGTVSRDPNIAVSCAHVVFENGTWLKNFSWANAHHSASSPSGTSAKPLRGYWCWTSYTGGTSGNAFNNDFVVHYSGNSLARGAYSGWLYNDSTSSHALASTSTSKLMVGYPGSDKWYQNSVGSFTSRFTSSTGHYMWNSSVKVVPGMSGGGAFVWSGSQWQLAGVIVSAYPDGSMGAGVRALNKSAYDLMTRAIESARSSVVTGTTKTFSSTSPLSIPDNSSLWTVSSLPVSGMPLSITSAKISVDIGHPYIGDLQVTLTSPTGRSFTLHDRTGDSSDNVVISNLDLSSTFAGTNPNGTWRVSVRDLTFKDVGTLNSATLTLTAR